MDKRSPPHCPAGGDRPVAFPEGGAAALIVREGILFTKAYAAFLTEAYQLKVFTAVNETAARRYLDTHPEIIFMLADNRLPDVNGVERDGLGLALAEGYGLPTILVTGGPVYSNDNPLVKCVFAINWPALVTTTRWVMGVVRRQAASRKDEQSLAAAQADVRRTSIALYRELAREQPAPPGFQQYEPIDERHLRNLREPPPLALEKLTSPKMAK